MHKQKNITKILVLVAVLLLTIKLNAQNHIWSPYSRYGIGELSQMSSPYYSSMGGTAIGVQSPFVINTKNPASLSAIPSKSFLFDGSMIFNPRIIENHSTKESSLYSGLNSLNFAFSSGEKLGFSFGLEPFTSVGYNIKDSAFIEDIGGVKYIYEGQGGINNFYFSGAYELFDGFSLGVNANYYFGYIDRKRIALFDTVGFINTRISNELNVSDIHLKLGMQYNRNIKKSVVKDGVTIKEPTDYGFTLGFVFGNPSSINTKGRKLAERFPGLNPDAIARDTIYNEYNSDGNIKLPLMLGGGASFYKKDRWLIGMDIEWTKWSDFLILGVSDSLSNSLSVSLGGRYTPKESISRNILLKSTYLFGVHYYDNYIELSNTSLKQYGMSFGMALPIRRTKTAINFSVELGKNGTTQSNLIKETYGKIKIGVSITENWFMRRQFE